MRATVLVALFAVGAAKSATSLLATKGDTGNKAKGVIVAAIEDEMADMKTQLQTAKVEFAKEEGRLQTMISAAEGRVKKYTLEKDAASAEVEKNTARGDELRQKITELRALIADHTKDIDQSNKVLTLETDHFKRKLTDLAESKDALKRAINVLSEQPAYTAQASLLQTLKKTGPVSVQKAVSEFLQQNQPAGKADAAQFQSGAILELMEKLLGEFAKEFNDTDIAFKENSQSMKMLIQRLKQEKELEEQSEMDAEKFLAEANNGRSVGESIRSSRSNQIAREEKTIEESNASLGNKTSKMNDMQEETSSKLESFKESLQQLKESMGGFFLQMKSVSPQNRGTEFLKAKAEKLGSNILAQAAESVGTATGADALSKIRRMVENMIMKLEEEAIEEQRRHGGCQTDLGKNKRKRKNTQSAKEGAAADKDGFEATVERLTEEINEHNQIVTDQTHEINGLTADREDEAYAFKRGHDKQSRSLANVLEAQDALPADADSIRNLIEQTLKPNMEALLEHMQAREDSQEEDYTNMRRDLESSNGENKQDASEKTRQLNAAKESLNTSSDALSSASKANQKANEEYEILKRNCIAASETHEDRMEKMSEEIQSLKDALVIIQGENTGF